MRRSIKIIGNNQLAAYLTRHTAAFGNGWLHGQSAEEMESGKPSLHILVERLDRLHPSTVAAKRTQATLLIAFRRALIFVGPYSTGDAPGCAFCLALRAYGTDRLQFRKEEEKSDSSQPVPVFSPAGLNAVKHILAAELHALAQDKSPQTAQGTLIVDARSGSVSYEALLPSSQCPVCAVPEPKSTVPVFAAPGSDTDLFPSQGFRRADAGGLTTRLVSTYLHRHTGMVKEVLYDLQSPFAACTLELNLADRKEYVLGRSGTFEKSRSVALLEAIERFCGMRQPSSSKVVTAPFEAIAERAINPLDLGLYPEESYESPAFPFQKFSPQTVSDWIAAYSLSRRREVLVPASVAFYGHKQSHGRPFLVDSSNGCAVGSSIEEATLHGLFEAVERDAFLLAWYRKLALEEVDLENVTDQEVRTLLLKAETVTNCRYRIFRSTMEHGIPSAAAVAVSKRRTGPQIMASGGAHLQFSRAVKSALYEVIGLVMRLRHQYEKKEERGCRMFQDSSLVRTIEDHPISNSVPQARQRFDFLLEAGLHKISWTEACGKDPQISGSTARAVVAEVVGLLQHAGLETIVLDQTVSEAAAGGVHCVKTIVPELLPMTFGHVFRRVNLRRLTDPARCGYVSGLPASEEPGLIPHPFP